VSDPLVIGGHRSSNLEFYLARAGQARAEAEAATLAHVRERCLRSEAAWIVMAERAQHSEAMKAAEAVRKSEGGLTS
jgi:hypothetical protein